MGFGSYFRDMRIEKQITQKQIADVIKKKPMLVSNVENGKNGPFSDNDLNKTFPVFRTIEVRQTDWHPFLDALLGVWFLTLRVLFSCIPVSLVQA